VFGEIVAHSAFGPRFPGSAYADDGNVATLRTTDLNDDGRISYETMPLAHLNEDQFSNHLLANGDLVITRSGTCGIAAVFDDFSLPVLPGAFLIRFRMSERADPRFYRYYFNSPQGRSNILSVARGAVQQNLNITNVETLRVPLPPLPEQKRIVGLLSAYDDLIDNNRRRMVLLEEVARQLWREWFVRLRFPGHEHTRITSGVPEGWEKTTAFAAMEVLSGGTPKTTVSDYWDGEIPFYTPKDASDTAYVLQTERAITELGLKNCNSRLYDTNTVFISARGTVGKLNLASRPMAMSQSCYALIGKGYVSQMFLFCALKEAIEHFKQHAGGAVFDAIIVDTFKLIPFMIPDEKMVRLFEEAASPIFRQVANLMEQQEKLRAARDLLLPRLMSGALAV
jgi:type I restriction enzyme S subunit